jgi:hypothetical protein
MFRLCSDEYKAACVQDLEKNLGLFGDQEDGDHFDAGAAR